jgi:hypothetical protein
MVPSFAKLTPAFPWRNTQGTRLPRSSQHQPTILAHPGAANHLVLTTIRTIIRLRLGCSMTTGDPSGRTPRSYDRRVLGSLSPYDFYKNNEAS